MKTALSILVTFFVGASALAIDIVTEKTPLPPGTCQKFTFFRSLNVYKDPSLFLSDLNRLGDKQGKGWQQLTEDNPVLTALHGDVQLIQLGPPRPFKNFGAIAKLYEAAEPRLKWSENEAPAKKGKLPKQSTALVIPIQICGDDAYNSTLGFVLADDFRKAQEYDTRRASLPPSVYPNPVPVFPQTGSGR